MQSFNKNIIEFCSKKNNRLCIGLDIDNEKLSNQSVDYMRDFIFDIIDILLLSVDTITSFTNLDSKAYSILWTIRGFPANFLMFLLGIPLLPPRAGIIDVISAIIKFKLSTFLQGFPQIQIYDYLHSY